MSIRDVLILALVSYYEYQMSSSWHWSHIMSIRCPHLGTGFILWVSDVLILALVSYYEYQMSSSWHWSHIMSIRCPHLGTGLILWVPDVLILALVSYYEYQMSSSWHWSHSGDYSWVWEYMRNSWFLLSLLLDENLESTVPSVFYDLIRL